MKVRCRYASITIWQKCRTVDEQNRTDLLVDGVSIFTDTSYALPELESMLGKTVVLKIPSATIRGVVRSVGLDETVMQQYDNDPGLHDLFQYVKLGLYDVEAEGTYGSLMTGSCGLGRFRLNIQEGDLVQTSASSQPVRWADYRAARRRVRGLFSGLPRVKQAALALALKGEPVNLHSLAFALPPELRGEWQDMLQKIETSPTRGHSTRAGG
jgi:hypothetical protein